MTVTSGLDLPQGALVLCQAPRALLVNATLLRKSSEDLDFLFFGFYIYLAG